MKKINKPQVSRTSGNRKPRLHKTTSSAKLFNDDYKTVHTLTTTWGVSPGEVIRLIVYDWLRTQRVKELGDDSDSTKPSYERMLDEKLTPLIEAVRLLQRNVSRATSDFTEQSPQAPGSILRAIEDLRGLVEQASSDLAETGNQQLDHLQTLTKAVGLTNSLAGENFIANWMIRDMLLRYIVEVELMSKHSNPDDLERAVGDEKHVLWREGRQQVDHLQSGSELPEALRFNHSEQIFQATVHTSGASSLP